MSKELAQLEKQIADVDKRLAQFDDQTARVTAEVYRLRAAVETASTSVDVAETAKLPTWSAELLAKQNQIAALGRAKTAAIEERRDLVSRQNSLADSEDRELAATTAAEMRQAVVKVMGPYMETIVGAEGRILARGNHAATLGNFGIADLRRWYNVMKRNVNA